MSNSLFLVPNPILLSKNAQNGNKGNVKLKSSENKVLFQLSFDPEIFCGISPACGELESHSSRTLTFHLEETNVERSEISFIIKYCVIQPNTPPEKITEMMLDSAVMNESLTAVIKFSSHAEDAMKSISSAFKKKKSLKEAIKNDESRNIELEEIAMLEKKIAEKEQEKEELENKVKNIKVELELKENESKKLAMNPTFVNSFAYIGWIIFIFAILKRLLFK